MMATNKPDTGRAILRTIMFILPAATRMPGEGEHAYEAFSDYLRMGWDVAGESPRRVARVSLDRLRRKYQPNILDNWYEQFDWEERANIFDLAIVQATAAAMRDACVSSQANIAAFTSLATASLAREFERTLEALRLKKQTVSLPDLVKMGGELVKTLGALAPRNVDDEKRYSPNYGGLPEDELIATEVQALDAARALLMPGEPPIPGLTTALAGDSTG